MNQVKYNLQINGKNFLARIAGKQDGQLIVEVNDQQYLVAVNTVPSAAAQQPPAVVLNSASSTVSRQVESALPTQQSTQSKVAGRITAPIPGIVVSIPVQVGSTVQPGQVVAVIEAMKMENNLVADKSGVVKELLVSPGDEIQQGKLILTIV